MGTETPKVMLPVGGRPLLAHTLRAFEKANAVDQIVLVVAEDLLAWVAAEVVDAHEIRKVRRIVPGGAMRQDSVRLGLQAIASECRLVAIHDGARPLITAGLINRVVNRAAAHHGAAALAVQPSDTVRRGEGELFQVTLDRDKLWLMQTPQVFSCDLILSAHRRAMDQGHKGTDDVALVEAMGHPVMIVEGDRENIKVTTPEDFLFVEAVLSRREGK
jgi:2-C-methyl-D-erythritol 4-phosphate cytidylyltransferase